MKKFKLYTHLYWVKYTWESTNDSQHMEWDIRRCYYSDPHPQPGKDDKVFYTDSELTHALNHDCAEKIAFIVESRYIAPQTYEFLENNIDVFDRILTHNQDFIDQFPEKTTFYPHCNCLIKRADFELYNKTKLVSFISSEKQMNVSGHIMRHAIYSLYSKSNENWTRALLNDVRMDLYGSLASNYVEYKLDSVKDYRFQVVVENSVIDTYFTEKIIDCFVTGTIPIYYGTKKINDFFNSDGIIHFSTLEELFRILGELTEEQYLSRMAGVKDNYQRAQSFILAEDWLFENTDVFD
ncbi:MAG: hypothetical protein ACI9WC_001770 [Arenicella sp.]|jgi:hypothetical protein